MSPVVTLKALLESGVHFGHRTNKWNPKMRSYIFTERNGIHIINLQQTVELLDEAYDFIRDRVAEGGMVLFVGTKRQAQDTIREEAERCEMPYVNERWLGGTITNWFTIQKRIFELERLERMRDGGELDLLTKKEGLMIERDIQRLEHRLSGIRNMTRLPDILFVVDVVREDTAIHEANLKNIPVVALVDTNCDPSKIDYVIPSNDDAIRAIKLLVGKIADAVMEGKAIRSKDVEEEAQRAEAMPAEVSRFIEDDEELEDEDLLGESTLKYIGSTRKAEEEELLEEEVDEELEGVVDDDSAEQEDEQPEESIDDEAVTEAVDQEDAESDEEDLEEPDEESAEESAEEDDEEPAEEDQVEPTVDEEEEPAEDEEEEPAEEDGDEPAEEDGEEPAEE